MNPDEHIAAPYTPRERVENLGVEFCKGTSLEWSVELHDLLFSLLIYDRAKQKAMWVNVTMLEASKPFNSEMMLEKMQRYWLAQRGWCLSDQQD